VTFLPGELVGERLVGLPGLPAVISRSSLACCLAEVGAFAEATTSGEEGIRMAEAVQHPFNLAYAYAFAGRVFLLQGDLQRATPVLERGLRVCQAAHLPLLFPRLASALGVVYTQSGRLAEGLALLEQAVEHSAAMRIVYMHALWLIHLSEGYRLAGRLEEATPLAVRALELVRSHQEQGQQAYALHLLGNIAAHWEPLEIEPAETHYHQALGLANELEMRPLQAHCHRGLGTLYFKMGQQVRARAELSTAIALYRAMEVTFWLPPAEAALAEAEER
jgi:tetratricopeptide (TPR) repeat protein